MAETFNPFHHWLGLSPNIRNPHHFQLLGVSAKLTAPEQIKEAVDAGVRRNLDLLDKVTPGQHDELLEKMKQRILVARKTLLDPVARTQYLAKLKVQINSKPPESPPSKSNAAPTGDAVPPSPRSDAQQSPAASKPQPAAPPAQSTPDIAPAGLKTPMQAIPLAVPLNSQQSPTSQTPAPVVAAAIPAQPVSTNDNVPFGDVKIQRKISRKRKRSALGPIIGIAMLIMAAVGGFLIYQNFDAILKLARIQDGTLTPGTPTGVEPKTANSDPLAPVLGGPDRDQPAAPKEPLQPLPQLDLDKLPELSELDYENFVNQDRPKRGKPNPEINDPPIMADDDPPLVVDDNPPTVVRFDDAQLAKMRRQLERARRSLFRREKVQALNAIESATELLDEVRSNETKVFAPEQQPIARLVGDTAEVFNLIEGFWQQVAASSQSISGGQEIKIGEQIVGFLEADQQQVTVRNSGTNISYDYSFCPPGLAMSLSLQGAIPDMPVWSKQLAAFYAINQLDGSEHLDKIDELLRVAEEAGHDCSGIRRFAEFQFGQTGKPESKVDMPAKNQLDEAVAEFRTESSYEQPDDLTPGMAGMYAEFLMQIDSPNFQQHVAFLEEARQLAIHGGEASKIEDVILELDIYANIDAAELTCKSFLELSRSKLPPEQIRQLMERAIPFLKSTEGKTADPKDRKLLASRLTKLAESNRMFDSIRRLSQLN